MANDVDACFAFLSEHERASVDRLCEWLRIASVSTDPAYRDQVRAAAHWAAETIAGLGFDVELIETGGGEGHPIVLAHAHGAAGRAVPHVLFYGHYDVQPPDPLELWDHPPFEPAICPAVAGGPGERIVARGAVDDKGQVMTFLEALRAWREVAGLLAGGIELTIMLEGEEECGSVHLPEFLRSQRDRLQRCRFCLISDTGMLSRGRPAITTGVRGLMYTEVTLCGPAHDLHSGLWGGRVLNPATELARILAQLHDGDRRVTIPGFYDGVAALSESQRQQWRALGLDATAALAKIGLPPEADQGETGFTALEREWARPTAEINGLVSGYTGPGAKTIIPAQATAKVSFRLVDDQQPERIRDAFFAWLEARTPPGFRWRFRELGSGPPAVTPTDSPAVHAAGRAIRRASGHDAALIRSGGSIPVAGMLKSLVGLDTVFVGFGLDDDRVHAPNEKFELDCFRLGARTHVALLDELRRMDGR